VEESYELEHGVTWNELAKLWALAAPWSGVAEAWRNASRGAYELMHDRDLLPYVLHACVRLQTAVAVPMYRAVRTRTQYGCVCVCVCVRACARARARVCVCVVGGGGGGGGGVWGGQFNSSILSRISSARS
jgi:hypothetical protein